MITVIKNGINPKLNRYDYPELYVKICIDEGENVIVQYGRENAEAKMHTWLFLLDWTACIYSYRFL